MKKCPTHDLPLQTRHTVKAPFRRFYQCPESANNSCNYTDWINEPAVPGSPVQSSSQAPQSGPLSPNFNMPSTPNAQTNPPSSQLYPEAPSTPTPKRNLSAVDSSDENRRASSQKRLKIIQDTLLSSPSPAHAGHLSASSSSQTGRLQLALGAFSNKDDVSLASLAPSTSVRTSEPVASGSNEDPFQGPSSSIIGEQKLEGQSSSSLQQIVQEESSDAVVETVSDMIRRLETLPEYIRRFEGKKIAAEKSRDAKNTKMINLQHRVDILELEVQRLRAREKQLEEVIEAYERQ